MKSSWIILAIVLGAAGCGGNGSGSSAPAPSTGTWSLSESWENGDTFSGSMTLVEAAGGQITGNWSGTASSGMNVEGTLDGARDGTSIVLNLHWSDCPSTCVDLFHGGYTPERIAGTYPVASNPSESNTLVAVR